MGVSDGDGRRVGSRGYAVQWSDVWLDDRAKVRVHGTQVPEVARLKAEEAQYAAVVTVAERQAEIGEPDSYEGSRNQCHNSPSGRKAGCQEPDGRSQLGCSHRSTGRP